jgi:hypothetical protein
MQGQSALELALALHRAPTLAKAMRRGPLPAGVLALLQIAGGSEPVRQSSAAETGRSVSEIEAAASFYIQQVLLHRRADCYRILGATRETPLAVLKEHRSWLLRWIHPDRNRDEWERVFIYRVQTAWDEIGRDHDRRRTTLPGAPQRNDVRAAIRLRRNAPAWIALPVEDPASARRRRWLKILAAAGSAVVIGSLAIAAIASQQSPHPASLAEIAGQPER